MDIAPPSQITTHLAHILKAGNAAPSIENTTPWNFRLVDESTVELLHNRTTNTPKNFYNVQWIADYISLGAVIENMFIQAAAEQMETTVVYATTPDSPLIATLTFFPRAQNIEQLVNRVANDIFTRHTDRFLYTDKSIPAEFLSILTKKARALDASLAIRENLSAEFCKVVARHTAMFWEDKDTREKFAENIRPRGEGPEGLATETLGIPLLHQFIFPMTLKLARHISVIWKFVSKSAYRNAREALLHTPAFALLTIPSSGVRPTRMDFIEGGRIFERLWLEMTELNLSVQPLYGPIEMFYVTEKELSGVSPKLVALREQLLHALQEYYPDTHDGQTPLMFFRLGYGTFHTPTPRPPFESKIVK